MNTQLGERALHSTTSHWPEPDRCATHLHAGQIARADDATGNTRSVAALTQPGWDGVGGPRTINPLKDDGSLIKYVSNLTELAAPGEADDALMAFQHRLCVSGDPTDVPWGRVPWPKPPNYDPDDFLLMQRAIEAGDSSPYQNMPPSMMRASASGACKKKKYTVCCGISVVASDQPMLNKGWANATWERKQEIIAEHTCVTYSVRYAPVPVPSDLHWLKCLHLNAAKLVAVAGIKNDDEC